MDEDSDADDQQEHAIMAHVGALLSSHKRPLVIRVFEAWEKHILPAKARMEQDGLDASSMLGRLHSL